MIYCAHGAHLLFMRVYMFVKDKKKHQNFVIQNKNHVLGKIYKAKKKKKFRFFTKTNNFKESIVFSSNILLLYKSEGVLSDK